MSNIKVLVCIHKDDVYLKNKDYLPIHVGKALSNIDLGIQGDDTGDNISIKNPSYCELTAMYWAWKNLKNIDYIGLCHYRRYFDFHKQCRKGFPYTIFPTNECQNKDISIPESIIKKLEKGYAIVPEKICHNTSLFNNYCTCHISDDLKTLECIINETCDKKYKDAFDKIMNRTNELFPCNMFILKWNDFDKYCTWLFNILSEAEKRINIEHYSNYQKRIFGFMGERLLNIFLYAENIKTSKYPLIYFSNEEEEEKISYIKQKYRNLLYKISMMFSMSPKFWFK